MVNVPHIPAKEINLAEEKGGHLCCLYLMWGRQSICKFFRLATATDFSSPSPIHPECAHVRFSNRREDGSQWDYPLCASKEAWVDAMTWKRGRGGRDTRKIWRHRFQHFNQMVQTHPGRPRARRDIRRGR